MRIFINVPEPSYKRAWTLNRVAHGTNAHLFRTLGMFHKRSMERYPRVEIHGRDKEQRMERYDNLIRVLEHYSSVYGNINTVKRAYVEHANLELLPMSNLF